MKKQKPYMYSIMSAVFLLCILILAGGERLTAEASSKVIVKKVTSVDFYTGKRTIKLAKGKTTDLDTVVKVVPNRPENRRVTYKSSNKRVAAVTNWGRITARKPGTAKITVTSVKNKKRKAVVRVTVNKYKPKYKYKVMFLSQPYSSLTNIMYVKTNNPSGKFRVRLYNSTDDGLIQSIQRVPAFEYEDLKDLKGPGFWRTDGGYVGECSYETSGKFKVRVEEVKMGQYVWAGIPKNDWCVTGYVDLGYIDVKNYAKEKKAWMESVINEVTTSSMTKKEKMYAIQGYMQNHSIYSKTAEGRAGYIYLAADMGIPFWKCPKYEFNSFESPALLKDFADMIDYPVENLYYKYEYGTEQWKTYHSFVQSLEDGTLFSFCPAVSTNVLDISQIKQIDLSSWNFYECYK